MHSERELCPFSGTKGVDGQESRTRNLAGPEFDSPRLHSSHQFAPASLWKHKSTRPPKRERLPDIP